MKSVIVTAREKEQDHEREVGRIRNRENFYRFFFVVFYYFRNIADAISYIADAMIGRNSFNLEWGKRRNGKIKY